MNKQDFKILQAEHKILCIERDKAVLYYEDLLNQAEKIRKEQLFPMDTELRNLENKMYPRKK